VLPIVLAEILISFLSFSWGLNSNSIQIGHYSNHTYSLRLGGPRCHCVLEPHKCVRSGCVRNYIRKISTFCRAQTNVFQYDYCAKEHW